MNSDSEEDEDVCHQVMRDGDVTNTNSTADHSPCKSLYRRKAATLNIPMLSKPAPTKEQLDARRVSIECISVAASSRHEVRDSDSIIERQLSQFQEASHKPTFGNYSMPRQREAEDLTRADDLLCAPQLRATDLLPNVAATPTPGLPLKRSFFQLASNDSSSDETSYHSKRQKVVPELIYDELPT